MKRIILMLALSICASIALAGGNPATYDGASGVLVIPEVSVDGVKGTYSVTLQKRAHSLGDYVFDLNKDTVTLNNAGGFGDSQGAVQGRQYKPPYYVFSPDIPHDVVSHDSGAIGLQPFVNNLAWETFIAINWPVPDVLLERGVPDRMKVIGGTLGKSSEGGQGCTNTRRPCCLGDI